MSNNDRVTSEDVTKFINSVVAISLIRSAPESSEPAVIVIQSAPDSLWFNQHQTILTMDSNCMGRDDPILYTEVKIKVKIKIKIKVKRMKMIN